MKKIVVLLVFLMALIFPWACSDNNTPSTPSAPTLGGSTPTNSPTGTITPGLPTATSTFTPVPTGGTPTATFAVNTPVWKYNNVLSASPNAMVQVISGGVTTINVVEGEPSISAIGVYTVQASGLLTGGVAGNLVVIGVPTPIATPPCQGTTVVLFDPVGIGFSPLSNTFAILDEGSPATLYEQNPNACPQFYTNYTTSYGGNLYAFNSPQGLAVDSIGNHYVADTGSGNIYVFGEPSGFGPPFTPPWEWQFDGADVGTDFKKPYGLFCDSNDNLWVGDIGSNPAKIYEFATIGPAGSGGSTFIGSFSTIANCLPHGIAVDQSASCNGVPGPCVYVADPGNNKVEEYTTTGVLLRAWGLPVSNTEFDTFKPSSIVLVGNPIAYIVVSDSGNRELQVFVGP